MKTLFLIFMTVIAFNSNAQNTPDPVQEVFDIPEKNAQFPGGEEALQLYIANNLMYPQVAIDKKEQGTVLVRLFIGVDGSIKDIKIMLGVSEALDKEATRVVKGMPNWLPAEQNGHKVPTLYTLPIKFTLN